MSKIIQCKYCGELYTGDGSHNCGNAHKKIDYEEIRPIAWIALIVGIILCIIIGYPILLLIEFLIKQGYGTYVIGFWMFGVLIYMIYGIVRFMK